MILYSLSVLQLNDHLPLFLLLLLQVKHFYVLSFIRTLDSKGLAYLFWVHLRILERGSCGKLF
jgi:hypothetical protein